MGSNWATFWVALCLFASSIEPIVIKIGYRSPTTPLQFLVVKSLIGGLLILPLTRTWKWVGWSGLKRMGTVSGLYLLATITYFIALRYLSALTVITISTTTPALVAIVNQIRGRDRLSPTFWLGFFLCFFGVFLNVGIQEENLAFSLVGFLCVAGSVLASAAYRTTMDGVTHEFPPILVSTYLFLLNGLLALLCFPFVGTIPTEAWPIGCWMGLAGAFANIAFLFAIHLLGSTRISILTILQRPLVILLTAFILREPITLLQGLGILMVFVGVPLAKVEKREPVMA